MSSPAANETPDEFTRLDTFVKASPGSEYTIDQKEQTLCRSAPSGKRECVKLDLECKYSQNDCVYMSCVKKVK